MSGSKTRTLALLLLPIILAGSLSTWVNVTSSNSQLEARTAQFGNAIADQLALTIADPMMQRDLLSLNVILSDLLAKGNFQFASVYGADNRLLAQVGKNSADLIVFTKDVVFQNASAGYVQLGFKRGDVTSPTRATIAVAVIVHLFIIGLITVMVWIYGDLLYFWWSKPDAQASSSVGEDTTSIDPTVDDDGIEDISGDLTILVIKVRPVRQLQANLEKITSALSLYRGQVEITEGDDIIVTFASHDQVFQAICCGMLISKIMARARGSNQVKLGMHVAALTEGEDVAKARKHCTYLASISENKLLASRKVYHKVGQSDRMKLQAFHSSLTPDGEVYFLESLNPGNAELIERQARQFF